MTKQLDGSVLAEPLRSAHAVHRMPYGAQIEPDGCVRFRVWAPQAENVLLALEEQSEPLAMTCSAGGWHELTTCAAHHGTRYRYQLPNGLRVPDPASRFQPKDVNGPSEVIDPERFTWRHVDWQGCPWEQAVVYELHIGAFTPEGTFLAAIGKLPALAGLGVTAIEIMSIGDFPGRFNWGYDGVLLYAPDSTYGRPEDLKSLVDAAHAHGIMVILDVVYNHFGPEGNYIAQYFPEIVTSAYETPWGQALNFDAHHGERTREFIIHNALYWIEEFRMDGLRLDAVHAIIDSSSVHILDELAEAVREVAGDRPVHLILESDDRVWHHLRRDEIMRPLSSTAQWNHDVQKLLALALTSGRSEERDRADTELLGRALTEGFTSGRQHRNAPGNVVEFAISPAGFISFLQSHDVVGNRIAGERLTQLAPEPIVRAIASVYLLAPQIPMLFMGEEWGASTPFPYFCDFQGDLADAIRKGRLEQFATPGQRQDAAFVAAAPDPLSPGTALSAKLRWQERDAPEHAAWLDWYGRILKTRRTAIVPCLRELHATPGSYLVAGPRQLEVRWNLGRQTLCMRGNFCANENAGFHRGRGQELWLEGTQPTEHCLGPWSVAWTLEPK